MRKRCLTLLLALGLVLVPLGLTPARAQWAVVDVPHTVQAYVLQGGILAREIMAYYQRVEQLYRQYLQLQTMYKNLESYRNGGSWLGAASLINGLDQLIQQNPNLLPGYRSFSTVFLEHFPGERLPVHFPREELKRLKDLRQSYYYIQQALRRIASADPGAATALGRAITASKTADGQLEELEAGNMIASVAASEATRSVRSTEYLASALALQASYETQRETTRQQILGRWIVSGPGPGLGTDPNSAGYRPVPPGFAVNPLF